LIRDFVQEIPSLPEVSKQKAATLPKVTTPVDRILDLFMQLPVSMKVTECALSSKKLFKLN